MRDSTVIHKSRILSSLYIIIYVVDIALKFLNVHISHGSCGIFIFRFCEIMKKFTLISPCSYGPGLPLAGVSSKQGTTLSPPQSLMDFSPLSQLTNHIIAGLNELRQCAAIGVSASVHRQLLVVMKCVIHELHKYHRCVLYMLCCNDVCM